MMNMSFCKIVRSKLSRFLETDTLYGVKEMIKMLSFTFQFHKIKDKN